VADNRIGDVGAKALADALKSNASVTKIDLGCKKSEFCFGFGLVLCWLRRVLANRIGDDGVKVLADALEINTAVVEMELGGEKEARSAWYLGSWRRCFGFKGNAINQRWILLDASSAFGSKRGLHFWKIMKWPKSDLIHTQELTWKSIHAEILNFVIAMHSLNLTCTSFCSSLTRFRIGNEHNRRIAKCDWSRTFSKSIRNCRYCDLNEIVEECPFEIGKTKKTVNVKNECKARELCCVSVCVCVSERTKRDTQVESIPTSSASNPKRFTKVFDSLTQWNTDTQNERQHVIHCDREQHNQSKSKKQQRDANAKMQKCKNAKMQKCKNAKCKNAITTKNIIHKKVKLRERAARESHSKISIKCNSTTHKTNRHTERAQEREENKK
jgi:hypothetical protein